RTRSWKRCGRNCWRPGSGRPCAQASCSAWRRRPRGGSRSESAGAWPRRTPSAGWMRRKWRWRRLERSCGGPRRRYAGGARRPGGTGGPVAQVLGVPAEYGNASQAAWGPAAQYSVVDDERAVQRAIEFLRKQRAGRATFMALDAVRPRPRPEEARALLQTAGVL